PLAAAIVRAAAERGVDPSASACEGTPSTTPGLGVEANVGGRRYRLGAHAFVAQWHPSLAPPDELDGETLVWLADERRPLARIHFRDRLRDEARDVVDTLAARGLRVHLLSGDRPASARTVARELAIEHVAAGAGPADKLEYVRALQREGRRVAMIGDGVNDAPVLAAADVSVAVGEATSLARTAASVVLLGGSLRELSALHALALRTRRVIRQNLGWAFAYNVAAIPAAALGWVPPWLAALGMTASSLLVVLNALRLIPGTPRPARAVVHATSRADAIDTAQPTQVAHDRRIAEPTRAPAHDAAAHA
ncbi:MAG TPA: HAD-IC family P-type ATPase, partial [Zeimonas sp.]